MSKQQAKIALLGNPNSGKTTLFNALTGLSQTVGNYPGVTVEKHSGKLNYSKGSDKIDAIITDLPGLYSLNPRSEDERVVAKMLADKTNKDFPDTIVYVADASNLKRSLLLYTQLIDKEIPLVLALNMVDVAEQKQLEIDPAKMAKALGIPVVAVNARKKEGFPKLLTALSNATIPKKIDFYPTPETEETTVISNRYQYIDSILEQCLSKPATTNDRTTTQRLDKWMTHPIGGFVIFLAILFLSFQGIFSLAEAPMDWIEGGFLWLSTWLQNILPPGQLTNLLTDGVIAGLAGVMVFIPQIAILFLFIGIMEDTGYMARVSFIMDKSMRRFGLNGRSVIPLISGVACAVPAIMSARTIGNWKERMITILVTPLTTCAARLPVYTLLISLVIPSKQLFGIFNLKGVTLMLLYLLGFAAALLAAFALQYILKTKEKSYFIMEMPDYKAPSPLNVALTVWEKVKVFIWDAGKIIVAISIVLWFLASHGPGNDLEQIDTRYDAMASQAELSEQQLQQQSSEKLEASYAGIVGKAMEPAIAPLGFNWKIGIALLTSFAAREVFVGTISTIYSVGAEGTEKTIVERMRADRNPETGQPVYTLAVGLSLLLFYAFAMQCMSTLAIVFRETGSIKWPLIQLVYMSALAYFSALLVYNLCS